MYHNKTGKMKCNLLNCISLIHLLSNQKNYQEDVEMHFDNK